MFETEWRHIEAAVALKDLGWKSEKAAEAKWKCEMEMTVIVFCCLYILATLQSTRFSFQDSFHLPFVNTGPFTLILMLKNKALDRECKFMSCRVRYQHSS